MKPIESTPSAFTPAASTRTTPSLSTAELLRRIDEMAMTPHDRARAKASLLRSEYIAESLASVVTALQSLGARIALASTRRSALRNSPAPR